jgi:translation elongation factor EF-Tu-like GTPase
MNRSADAEVILRLISTADGGKERTILSGYRPNYAIRDDYFTSTNHELIGAAELAPGTEGRANVWFITPEVYPHTLWPGREISVLEGSRVVGTAIVVHVFNSILLAENG